MSMVKVDIEFNDDGTANITLPGGKKVVNADPTKVADLTLQLAKGLGPIKERHAAHTHIKLDDGSEKIVWHQNQGS